MKKFEPRSETLWWKYKSKSDLDSLKLFSLNFEKVENMRKVQCGCLNQMLSDILPFVSQIPLSINNFLSF